MREQSTSSIGVEGHPTRARAPSGDSPPGRRQGSELPSSCWGPRRHFRGAFVRYGKKYRLPFAGMATKAPTPPPGRRRATASGSEPPRLLIAALVIMGLAMLLVAIAGAFSSGHAETFQVGNLILEVDGDYAPPRLPANELAPIELEGEGHGRTDDGSLVPVTKEVIADFDKNGTLTTRGIDQCNPRSLQNTTTRQALKKCKSSLVGKGQVSGGVDFPDQKPFAARGPLLIFNGTKKGGDPSVIFHVLADVALPPTFLVHAALTKSPL